MNSGPDTRFDPRLFEFVACNFCGSSDFVVKYEPRRVPTAEDMILSVSWAERDTQRIVRCRNCGLIFVNPRPRKDLVLSRYRDEQEAHYANQAAGRLSSFTRSLQLIEKHRPQKGRLLDIGAAAGFFMKVAKDSGWVVAGIEPNVWLCDYGRKQLGVEILNRALDNELFAAGEFDVVTMWDVIEHVHDPANVLQIAHRLLKKDGLLVLNTPNAGSWLARLFGRRWWFYLSVHLYYFTPPVLARKARQLGYEVIATRPHFQTLSLGHLVRMFSMYGKTLSDAAYKAMCAANLTELPIRFYASQFTLLARKV